MLNYRDITIGDLEKYSPKKAANIIEHIVRQKQADATILAIMAEDVWRYSHKTDDCK